MGRKTAHLTVGLGSTALVIAVLLLRYAGRDIQSLTRRPNPLTSDSVYAAGYHSTRPSDPERPVDGVSESVDDLRALLRSGTRVQRVAALQRMQMADRALGQARYETDVLVTVGDEDVVVAAAAADLVLGYYSSELFRRNRSFTFPDGLGVRALEHYLRHGDYMANASEGAEAEWCSVPLLGVSLALAERSRGGALLAACEHAFFELERRCKPAEALAIGKVLALEGRPVAKEQALSLLKSGDPRLTCDAVEIVRMSGDVAVIPALREAYEAQHRGAAAKEAIIRAMAALDPALAQENLLDVLGFEEEPLRRGQIIDELRKAGVSERALADELVRRFHTSARATNLPVAAVLATIGDHRLAPALRTELEDAASMGPSVDKARLTQVIRLLGAMRDPQAYRGLSVAYESLHDPNVRRAILDAARQIGTSEAVSWANSVSGR